MNLKPIVRAIPLEYTLPRHGIHGVCHWARVLKNGLRLAALTGANLQVIQLFALFHDSRRRNESSDPEHGLRGARFATRLRGELFDLSDDQFDLLSTARADHTAGRTHADITIQTCWDADRLDLGRMGMRPDPRLLCTEAARRPEILKWADGRGAFHVVPETILMEWGINPKS